MLVVPGGGHSRKRSGIRSVPVRRKRMRRRFFLKRLDAAFVYTSTTQDRAIMITLVDVAKVAGVSVATASMVLNPGKGAARVGPERAERVRQAASQLGYHGNYHARAMQVGRAETIGLALDFGQAGAEPSLEVPMGGEYFHHLTVGVEEQTHFVGYNLAIIGPGHQERAIDRGVRQIRQRRLDALVVPGVLSSVRHNRVLGENRDLPIVLVESDGIGDLPVVTYDEAEGVRRAVAHLAALGHRDLLWLGPACDGNPNLREQLFIKAVWDAGLRGASCRYPEPTGRFTRTTIADAAHAALRGLLAEPRTFTAVVCYNDFNALGAYAALLGAGLAIPHDVSVVGFDDFIATYVWPRMTTVSHMMVQMGKRAGELAIEMAGSAEALVRLRGHREVLAPELIVRDSTGPARR
jgi:DNA-binding LacI/PurR family transcriptional regulator